jgi:hypothetical protein
MGIEEREWAADSYSARKPAVLPKVTRAKLDVASEPSEWVIRESMLRALRSARRAWSICSSRETSRSFGSRRARSGRSVEKLSSGSPA